MANSTLEMTSVLKHPAVFQGRALFYMVTPNETSFPTEQHVPRYVDMAIPYFLAMIVLEAILLIAQGKDLPRPNNAYSSMSAGTLSLLPLVLFRSIEVTAYGWVYTNYCLHELPWNWSGTWWLGMLAYDFLFYWRHRATHGLVILMAYRHEVNVLWATHESHHSSEDFNLSTALRQPLFERFGTWMFYLPMALFIPPSVFMVHQQLNTLYQYWIHTQAVTTLGPLEWVFNTPSHHRVHHGRNRKYIDKNYAAVLIIWDRMFGTFQKEEEEVVFGITKPVSSWDAMYIQLGHLKHVIKMAYKRKTWKNKLFTFINGPGWSPGKPRMGLRTDIPEVRTPITKYDRSVGILLDMYIWAHFGLASLGYGLIQDYKQDFSFLERLCVVMYILWTICNMGYIYDIRWYATFSEFLRCVTYLGCDAYLCSGQVTCSLLAQPIRVMYMVSLVIWGLKLGQGISKSSSLKSE